MSYAFGINSKNFLSSLNHSRFSPIFPMPFFISISIFFHLIFRYILCFCLIYKILSSSCDYLFFCLQMPNYSCTIYGKGNPTSTALLLLSANSYVGIFWICLWVFCSMPPRCVFPLLHHSTWGTIAIHRELVNRVIPPTLFWSIEFWVFKAFLHTF